MRARVLFPLRWLDVFFPHRDCYGFQFFRCGRWTAACWWVPITTKLAPHRHPGQNVTIWPLFGINTTFNCCPMGEYPQGVKTAKAWPLRPVFTPAGWFHFANKETPSKPRRGPFVFINVIEWLDGVPRHPRDGYEVVHL